MESYDKKNRISGVHGVGIDDADAGVPTIRARAERVGKFAFRPSLPQGSSSQGLFDMYYVNVGPIRAHTRLLNSFQL